MGKVEARVRRLSTPQPGGRGMYESRRVQSRGGKYDEKVLPETAEKEERVE